MTYCGDEDAIEIEIKRPLCGRVGRRRACCDHFNKSQKELITDVIIVSNGAVTVAWRDVVQQSIFTHQLLVSNGPLSFFPIQGCSKIKSLISNGKLKQFSRLNHRILNSTLHLYQIYKIKSNI